MTNPKKVFLYKVLITDHKSRMKDQKQLPVKAVLMTYTEGMESDIHFIRRALKYAQKEPNEALSGRYTFSWVKVREVESL